MKNKIKKLKKNKKKNKLKESKRKNKFKSAKREDQAKENNKITIITVSIVVGNMSFQLLHVLDVIEKLLHMKPVELIS